MFKLYYWVIDNLFTYYVYDSMLITLCLFTYDLWDYWEFEIYDIWELRFRLFWNSPREKYEKNHFYLQPIELNYWSVELLINKHCNWKNYLYLSVITKKTENFIYLFIYFYLKWFFFFSLLISYHIKIESFVLFFLI